MGAAARTPAEIIDKLNREISLAMADRQIAAFFDGLGTVDSIGSAPDFGRLMEAEGAKWAAALKASGAALE